MKKIITSVLAILFISNVIAQQKSDKYLGVSFGTSKVGSENSATNFDLKDQFIGLNYSSFIETNRRLNFNFALTYFDLEDTQNNVLTRKIESNGFIFGIGYGILYPLLKNFYAEVTPNIDYGRNKAETTDLNNPSNPNNSTRITNNYGLGVTGGLLWVPFKHFGLSTSLLSIRSGLSRSKETFDNNTNSTNTASAFELTNRGNLNSQIFTVFFKF